MAKYIVFLFFYSHFVKAWSLDKILKINDARSLKTYIQEENRQNFLKILCQKQKANQKPPVACYKIGLNPDTHCLSLKIADLNFKILKEALGSSTLSAPCRNHLSEKQKILLYRKKDFLNPGVKKLLDRFLYFV